MNTLETTEKVGGKRQYPEAVKQAARGMYLRRYTVPEIAKTLSVPPRTVYYWATAGEWDNLLTHESAEEAINRRLTLLAERDGKTPGEIKEFDTLIGSLERLQTLRLKAAQAARQPSEEPFRGEVLFNDRGEVEKTTRGKSGGKAKKIKNDVSMLTPELFAEKFHTRYFGYQHAFRASLEHRNRMFLKARQIGATWYFAQEAFEKAVLLGRNQIFLSATKAQSLVFRNYIMQLCAEAFDIELSGNPIILHTIGGKKVEMHFLSTSTRSAQSYHGDVYVDECFWIPKFKDLWKVASGMAAHKIFQRTLFSTPSAITHGAYPKWSGDEYQARYKKPQPWVTREQLRGGILCPDRMFRQIITLDDAEAGGCDLFDREELIWEYTPEEFKQLFGCEFMDDTQAVFRLQLLENCMADKADWTDVDTSKPRPVGNRGVWCGYDPSRCRDDASFVVLLPPLRESEKIRVIERHKWVNKSYIWQAERIKEITQKYRIDHMGIDVTGPGIGVFEQVRVFCPIATPINYSVQSKAQLVLKAQEVMEQNRLEWDAAETDIAHAFMTIKQTPTPGGGITYSANRTDTTGHADVAWSITHALSYEPLARQFSGNKSNVGIGH